ncbi:MAG: histidine phosphatase family protein [Burkholderiales bacterium]
MMRRAFGGIVGVTLTLLAAAANADELLWAALKEGGHVILIRHATTDPGTGDPPGFKLGDCSTQRNLSEAGRIEARRIGDAFAQRSIPVGEVRSSRWCRCLDTARIAFGSAQPWAMLDSLFADPAREAERTAAVKAFVLDYERGANAILVTHARNIAALVGSALAQGEMVILKSDHDRVKVLGRLKAD